MEQRRWSPRAPKSAGHGPEGDISGSYRYTRVYVRDDQGSVEDCELRGQPHSEPLAALIDEDKQTPGFSFEQMILHANKINNA